ncbi:porin [Oceanisphaera sp.]|uniref:porin n=1 Tax=Oceanisphaera sp. TaxID=1929979 RepID=UPI003A93E495
MKKTILALTIPALFATSASAVEIYSAEDGSKVDLYGRLQYNAGATGYQVATNAAGQYVDEDGNQVFDKAEAAASDERQNFGGAGLVRLGVNVNYVLNQDISLIGKYEANFDAEGGNSTNEIDTRYAWLGFRFMDTTELAFGKSEAPRAQLTNLTDTFDIFGGNATNAGGFNRVDDQIRLSYADNGIDLRAAYAFNDARKQDDNLDNTNHEDSRWGVSAGYTSPVGFGVVASYNQEDNNNVTNGEDDKTKEWGLGAHYSIDGFYFAGLYGQRDSDVLNADDDGSKFWELQAAYSVDAWTLIANYAKEDGRKASSGDEFIDEYTLGARYALNTKTKVYAEYVINEIGNKDDLYAMGIQYNF